eukprot:COSAG02_NODE_22577_length_747_cov_1.885802_1_plen_185_part_00
MPVRGGPRRRAPAAGPPPGRARARSGDARVGRTAGGTHAVMGLRAVTLLFSPVVLVHILTNGHFAAAQNAWAGPRPGGTLACAAGAQPCPTHPGHTWCPQIPDSGQCEKPPVACPPPHQLPFCNTSLGFRARAIDLVSRIPNASVKIGLLSTTSDGVPSLGIGSFEWCELYCHSSASFSDSWAG